MMPTSLTSPDLTSFLSLPQCTIHVPHSHSLYFFSLYLYIAFVGSLVARLWLTTIPHRHRHPHTILSARTNIRLFAFAVDAHTLTYPLAIASHRPPPLVLTHPLLPPTRPPIGVGCEGSG